MPPAELAGLLMRQRDRLLELGVQVTGAVDMAHVFRSTSVLFEGAQGVLLDLDFGTYPFVTSGSCMAHGVSSVGFSTFELDDVAGVLKAYTTRVGEGPFPSEDDTDVAGAFARGEKSTELRPAAHAVSGGWICRHCGMLPSGRDSPALSSPRRTC